MDEQARSEMTEARLDEIEKRAREATPGMLIVLMHHDRCRWYADESCNCGLSAAGDTARATPDLVAEVRRLRAQLATVTRERDELVGADAHIAECQQALVAAGVQPGPDGSVVQGIYALSERLSEAQASAAVMREACARAAEESTSWCSPESNTGKHVSRIAASIRALTPTAGRDVLAELRARAEAAEKQLAALDALFSGFADAVQAAVDHAQRPKGGQQVPFQGDFANAGPGTLARLEWWARAFRTALAKPPEGV